MDKIKIKNSEGKFINKDGKVVPESKAMNLVEAIDVNSKGELIINKFAYKTNFGNAKLSTNLKKDKGILEIKNLINKIAHDIHGNYNEELQAMGQRYVLGKMLSMFRKWVIPGFNRRWRGAVHFTKQQSELDAEVEAFYSEDMQAYQEGYYTTGARFLWQIGKNIKELKFHAISAQWDKLSDAELANMRRLSIEVGVMIASLAASTLLYMLAQGSDDPVERETLFYFTYFTRRLYSELRFYSNPVEAFKLMRDPSATLSYLGKIGRFAAQLQEDVFYNIPSGGGLEEFQAGKHKNKIKLEVRALSLVPGVNRGYSDVEETVGWLRNVY